jgi:prevent-host-death family protein
MSVVSISDLKANPSKVIAGSDDFPVAVESRNKIKAYLIGKDLYERIISYLEDQADQKTVERTDFNKGKDFEKVAKSLGI